VNAGTKDMPANNTSREPFKYGPDKPSMEKEPVARIPHFQQQVFTSARTDSKRIKENSVQLIKKSCCLPDCKPSLT
jgi:hypothetical protein